MTVSRVWICLQKVLKKKTVQVKVCILTLHNSTFMIYSGAYVKLNRPPPRSPPRFPRFEELAAAVPTCAQCISAFERERFFPFSDTRGCLRGPAPTQYGVLIKNGRTARKHRPFSGPQSDARKESAVLYTNIQIFFFFFFYQFRWPLLEKTNFIVLEVKNLLVCWLCL